MEFDRMLAYCAALEQNNDRTWFHENHAWYEAAKQDYLNLLDLLRFSIVENAPALADDLLGMQPKDWMYRVPRDARTNRNKPPYAPSFRAFLARDRRSWRPLGYFLLLAPGRSCFGTGLWPQTGAELSAARDYLLDHQAEFLALQKALPCPMGGEQRKRMPRGYEEAAQSPIEGELRRKNWSLLCPLPDDTALQSFADFDRTVRQLVCGLEPMRQFLYRASAKRFWDERAGE